MLARSTCHHRTFEITLADPSRRNALGAAMFSAIHARLMVAALAADDRLITHDGSRIGADVLVIRGEGHSFSAGFDLAACVADPIELRDLSPKPQNPNKSCERFLMMELIRSSMGPH